MDTKALRQKILDLAIRGKLVPQDPNDEPASVLLERIRAEKQQMVKDGKLKAKEIKNDTVIFLGDDNLHYEKFPDGTVNCIEDEIPFELPEGWEWTRLQAICEPITDGTHKTPTYSDEGFIFLSSKNVTSGHIDWDNIMYIPESLHNELYARLAPQKNDILLAKNGTTGVAAIVDRDCIFDIYVSLALLRIIGYIISPEYLLSTIASSTIQNYFNSSLKGIGVPNLHLEHIRTTLIPVAPINEQYRIATKLEQLLSFADNIESDKTDLQTTIQLAKSKILDLAIRGKLVPQNPDDEPASVLLERIRAEKEELIKQGKIKRDKKESVIFRGEDNSYYLRMGNLIETLDDWRINDIPYSWGICCLGEVCDYGNCTNVDTKDIPKTAWILDLEDIEKDTGKVSQKLTLKERNSASTKHSFHKGQVLYSKLRPYLNKVVLVDDDGYCTSEILPLDFNKYILPEYAKYYLMSPTFLRYANHCSYGVKMPRLGTLDGRKAVLIVPPVNEQKRIADKVSQLFSLLDSIADNVN
ncbi:restriction endonuclease subunit S [Ruminococcus sp.]|mgnify:CR=1 FL=1|jgi:type I restriction enzyme S subunit|uniref:restriction endonuclease subunit S n=1 Tax=Ruminococcus sp. TaxID=41978 RepID=UPI003A981647